MDTKTLCLGVLSLGEASGYEIKKVFEDAFVHFFPASFGSIYPALAELERQGLVSGHRVEQQGKPDKKIYAITESGYDELVGRLAVEEPRFKVRSEFLVLMFFSELLSQERLSEVFDLRLENLAQLEAKLADYVGDSSQSESTRFCAGYGLALVQAGSRFIKENRHRLEREDGKAGRKSS